MSHTECNKAVKYNLGPMACSKTVRSSLVNNRSELNMLVSRMFLLSESGNNNRFEE